MNTKAAVLYESGLKRPYEKSHPLHIEAVELSDPGPGEVLLQIKAVGLCHSDLSTINGNRPRPTPMVLGHEAVGIIVDCGPSVSTVQKGDTVSVVFVPSCGSCVPCSEGRPALCEPGAAANGKGTLLSGDIRIKGASGPVHHHLGVSGFAEYAVLSERSVVKIRDDIDYSIAALFGCAVLTGVGAVVNAASVQPGTTVGIVGMGGIGLNALLGAKAAGATNVVALDTNPEKLKVAASLGATDCFSAEDPDVAAQIKSKYGGLQTVIEAAGIPAAFELAYTITSRGGLTVSAGLSHPEKKISMQHVSLVAEERTIKGSYLGSCIPRRDIPRFIEMYRNGLLPVDRTLSGTLALDDINQGFENLAAGSVMRQVIVF
ncbi:MAG: alcohol dehydrogenase catalytic domain-containing protein [Leptospiraceae bacterium]|nr:alcohol dehydrogenase catalytic domain-containing protein [Leptospiraceae bacterium]